MNTRWTNRSIDRALAELSRAYEPTPDEVLAFESRVHREVDARFGVAAWTQPLQSSVIASPTRVPQRSRDKLRNLTRLNILRRVGLPRRGLLAMTPGVDVHTAPVPAFGMLEGLRVFLARPAFALATVVIVVAGVLAYRQSDDSTLANRPRDPQTSSAVAVVPAAPFGEGTGFAVSVFGGSLALAPTAASGVAPSKVIAPTVAPVRTGVRRSRPLPLNPTPGVFSQWGTSVFSDDEALTRPWEGGKSIFSS